MPAVTINTTENYFSHGTGIIVRTVGAKVLETIATSALVTIPLPKLAHDVVYVSVKNALGCINPASSGPNIGTVYSTLPFESYVVAETILSGVITPANLVFKPFFQLTTGMKIYVMVVL
jgi:hypothetical protein